MALAIFSELNFTVLIPFILADFGLETQQTATFMSVAAVTDIVFRFLAPYIGNFVKKSPRFLYISTLITLVITRFYLIVAGSYFEILIVAAVLGVAKGIRRVYVGLIVPSHVSLEKLPSASGMEMMSNGFCILVGGSLLGMVKDATGSYSVCIVIMNCVTLVPIITWTTEALIVRHAKTKNTSEENKAVEENIPLRKV